MKARDERPTDPKEGDAWNGRIFRGGKWWRDAVAKRWYCVVTGSTGEFLVEPYTRFDKLIELCRLDHLERDPLCPTANIRIVTSRGRVRRKRQKGVQCPIPFPTTSGSSSSSLSVDPIS